MIKVSNIERFATHDGPGIRTAVFLKGCPLCCPWCANPEAKEPRPVLMYKESVCLRCRRCEAVCPRHAIQWQNDAFEADRNACTACGECVRCCPGSALSLNGTEMSAEEILRIVLKDSDYYEESGGGVTFSGGEPLFQGQEAIALFAKAKEAGLHTAAETTGNVPASLMKQAEPYIDLFLFDLKHTDPAVLKTVTHAVPEQIFENFEYLTSLRPSDVIARIPVIPGFNQDAVEDLIAYAKSRHIKAIHLLPYHNLGKAKWHQLQKPYCYDDIPALKKEELERYCDALVSIGG
ncbi:MAG: glycyl-radical enzyme activating protein [Solobacterium sp.]|nr:glycyl-radical enzyme activating protein [Solobacterium sp.]